ncbi:MAG: hypothetical protein ACTHJ8_11170 [Mucilaginibacter sp.]|jgi:hypothetical protein
MEITIKEPATGEYIRLDAQPEEYHDELGWRIFYPQKDSFLIAREGGSWKAVDEQDINPELIDAIANSLRENEEYNSSSRP